MILPTTFEEKGLYPCDHRGGKICPWYPRAGSRSGCRWFWNRRTTKSGVKPSPPGWDEHWLALEDISGTTLIVPIEHGPIHDFFVLLTLDFRCICGFDLFPGSPGYIAIICNGFTPTKPVIFSETVRTNATIMSRSSFCLVEPLSSNACRKSFS